MDECDKVKADYELCNNKAYEDYKKAVAAGDDGRPDWMARKSCNYITATVEECGNMLVGNCNTYEEVTELKDQMLHGILHQLEQSIDEWDTKKCPVIKDHVGRMKAKEKGETVQANRKASVVDNDSGDASGRTSTASIASSEDCDKTKIEFNKCTKEAHEQFINAVQAGEDGRPDWIARKSCNYMTSAVEDCGDMLVGRCNTCEEVTAMKDEQLKKVLNNVKSSVKEWDSNKCPATKAHIERMKALEKGEKIESTCNLSLDDNVDGVPGFVTETARTAFAVSFLLLPFFV